MCEPITMTALVVGSAGLQAYSQYTQGQAQAAAADASAATSRAKAVYAEGIGAGEAGAIRQRGAAVIAEQRVAMAGNGVDISTGSAPNLFGSTAAAAELDAQKAKANAALEAWGHRQDAAVSEWQARTARRNSVLGPLGTIMGAGASVAGVQMKAAAARPPSGGAPSAMSFFAD